MVAGEGWERMPVAGSVLEPPLGTPERGSEASGRPSGSVLPPALRRCRRLVVGAVRMPEFLRAASGLTQRLGSAGVPIDVLVAGSGDERDDDVDLLALAELRSPSVRRHRLALPMPFGDDREDDLVAALSELIGFDPEPGVYCLVPAGEAPGHAPLRRAADRLAQVYRMRVLVYSDVSTGRGAAGTTLRLETDEWRRKSAALAAYSTTTPMTADERAERFAPA